jgi:hypothetical protein
MNESITWRPECDRPDCNMVVLVYGPSESDPIWLGYWDDQDSLWRSCEGGLIEVTHWAELPAGPKDI